MFFSRRWMLCCRLPSIMNSSSELLQRQLTVANIRHSSSELLQIIELTIQVPLARLGTGFGLAPTDIFRIESLQ